MDLLTQAMERFATLFARAQTLNLPEPAAVTLATVNSLGQPSVRTVLIKSFDTRGFVFYTNMRSRKGEQLAGNPHAALCFFWQPLMEQVLVEGKVESVSDAEADAYWLTRLRVSQLGAWASLQSQALTERSELERRFSEVEKKFNGQRVPRPSHWSGFRVAPIMIEFWSGRPGRLHERERYSSVNGAWQHNFIFP